MKCEYCNKEVNETLSNCPYCGAKIVVKKYDNLSLSERLKLREEMKNNGKLNNKNSMYLLIGGSVCVFLGMFFFIFFIAAIGCFAMLFVLENEALKSYYEEKEKLGNS